MTSDERRAGIRDVLLRKAKADERISGAAIIGSGARGAEDRWSDVDLFLGVAAGNRVLDVAADWTTFVHAEIGAVHHFDTDARLTVYRAFLTADLVEVDLAFTPAAAFGPLGESAFQVVFGDPVTRPHEERGPAEPSGHAWHHVRHARVCVERGALWQAEHWIGRLRDLGLAMACHRLGFPIEFNKHVDRLPATVTAAAEEALVRAVNATELRRCLRAATGLVLAELRLSNPAEARVLERPLLALASAFHELTP
jgi:predicted nucleotidyltransferase